MSGSCIENETTHASRWYGNLVAAGIYTLLLVLAIGAYLVVRSVGEAQQVVQTASSVVEATTTDVASTAAQTAATASRAPRLHLLTHVLATLSAVIVGGFVLGQVFRFIGQPPVIGEVVAGILLGPSLLGWLAPDVMHALIPSKAADPEGLVSSAIQNIAQLGVLLYMFVVGLELNAATLRQRIQTAVAISHLSIVLPFLLGAVLALWLAETYCPSGVSFTSFSLFVGVAMAITAFPVLARILTDRGLSKTRLGNIALAAAAADDVTAWCLLALVVGVVQSRVETALQVFLGAFVFIVCMFVIVRPLARRLCNKLDQQSGPVPGPALVVGLAAVLLCGLTTELIGIHAIFGGFLLGAIIPHDSRLANELKIKLNDVVTILLLPAFFAFTGMRTQIGLISGWENWFFCAVIILVATIGKFGGTLVAARCTGSSWNEATSLGVLMNTRGLMELIVLNIGLDLGVISPTLFAMMVLMALVTTIATSPALSLLTRRTAVV